jgi:hypothetical protein
MKRTLFTEAQIVSILKVADADMKMADRFKRCSLRDRFRSHDLPDFFDFVTWSSVSRFGFGSSVAAPSEKELRLLHNLPHLQ